MEPSQTSPHVGKRSTFEFDVDKRTTEKSKAKRVQKPDQFDRPLVRLPPSTALLIEMDWTSTATESDPAGEHEKGAKSTPPSSLSTC